MAESKIIFPGHQASRESVLKAFSSLLDKQDLSKLEDDEIETLLKSVSKFNARLARERPEVDQQIIRRYENALYTIQRITLRMCASTDNSIYELKEEIDKIIKGAKISERK